MSVTYAEIVAAVASVVDTNATSINDVQSGTDITESIQNLPVVQVYWESGEVDVSGQTDRTTFKTAANGGVQQEEVVVHADVYVRQRAHLGGDMAAVMPKADDVRAALVTAGGQSPFFGQIGIKSFRWRAERVTFSYSDVDYAGIRFIITMRVF